MASAERWERRFPRSGMSTEKTLNNIRANWPEAGSSQMECLLLVQRVARLLRENAQGTLGPLKLSFTEFEVLAALRASPPPHQLLPTELYDAMLISSGGLTKVLKYLEERGLISRPHHKGDKRQRPVALLAKGRRMAERGLASIIESDEAAISAHRSRMQTSNEPDFCSCSSRQLWRTGRSRQVDFAFNAAISDRLHFAALVTPTACCSKLG